MVDPRFLGRRALTEEEVAADYLVNSCLKLQENEQKIEPGEAGNAQQLFMFCICRRTHDLFVSKQFSSKWRTLWFLHTCVRTSVLKSIFRRRIQILLEAL